MKTIVRADGKILRRLFKHRFRRGVVTVDWQPPKLYKRFEVFHGHDHRDGDWAITCTVGRLELGWYSAQDAGS